MRLHLSFLLLLTPTALFAADKLPLCEEKCTCSYEVNSEQAKVTCVKNVKPLLYNNATWFNLSTNQSYGYLELTLTNQNFIELNFTFPKSALTYLNLANNDIYQISDNVFQNLQQMKVLILSNNDLTLLSPDAFKGKYLPERYDPLRSLIELRLDHNKLHTLDKDIFEHTSDLEVLDLSYNPLTVIDSHTEIAIDSLANLRELYLQYTNISTLPAYLLHTPAHLAILDLSGNPIDKVPETLSDSHNLTELYLNDTDFVNITKENGFFKDIPTVKVLHLCHVRNLEYIGKEALSGLTNLEELHISDNIRLTALDHFALAKVNERNGGSIWPQLKTLNLANNKLAYLDSDFLARWDALTSLDIQSNPWTCECENQWMVEDLMQTYLKIEPEKASTIRCGAPVEMIAFTFQQLYEEHYTMRCLDKYGAEPDKDAALLIGVLAGVLIAIPVVLFILFAIQRKWFGLFSMCDHSPAAYSRRYYTSTKDDDF